MTATRIDGRRWERETSEPVTTDSSVKMRCLDDDSIGYVGIYWHMNSPKFVKYVTDEEGQVVDHNPQYC